MSNEYAVALETSRKAFETFDTIRTAYRAGKVSDSEFLAARKTYIESEAAFDAAYAKETTS